MEENRAKEEPDAPVGKSRSEWTLQDRLKKGYVHFTEIQRLIEDLDEDEIKEHPYGTEHMDELPDKQYKELSHDFLRVSQNWDVSLSLYNKFSEFMGLKGLKCTSDVHGIIGKIHQQGRREMIPDDLGYPGFGIMRLGIDDTIFLSMIAHGPIKIGYSPNREFLQLKLNPDDVWSSYTCIEWHTSVRHNKLVKLLMCKDRSIMKGDGDCSITLQPQVVKDSVCYVSRTSGGMPPARRTWHRHLGTFKRRLRVVMTGTGDSPYYITPSGRLITCKRAVGLWTGTPHYITRSFRRFRCPRAPPLWIYDTGSSVSVTGDRRLLRGVHKADCMSSAGVSGVELVSNRCGHIRSGRVKLSGVRYFPEAKVNLISGGILASLGCEIIMNARGLKIMKGGQVIGAGRRLPNNTYSLEHLDDKLIGGTVCPHCRH